MGAPCGSVSTRWEVPEAEPSPKRGQGRGRSSHVHTKDQTAILTETLFPNCFRKSQRPALKSATPPLGFPATDPKSDLSFVGVGSIKPWPGVASDQVIA